MNYIEFGTTGEQVSEMCLGTMMFGSRCDGTESDRILGAAIDHGVNFIDTAAMYAGGLTEELLGRIMGSRRDNLFLATKVHKGIDAASILTSIDESLTRLRTDHVDLYLLHWPVPGMNPVEIMEALSKVVAAGKARFVGCCNFPAWLLAHCNSIAAANGWPRLVNNQVAYNIIERGIEVEILPQAVAEHIAITAYRPLAMGLLTGKYRWGQPLPDNSRGQTSSQIITWLSQYGPGLDRFIDFAAKLGVEPGVLAAAWVRYSPAVTSPIIGVSSLHQLQAGIDAFDCNLSVEEYDEITWMFDTEVKEEGLQRFPGLRYNFPRLRRNLDLLGK